jgi:hypothetical protein
MSVGVGRDILLFTEATQFDPRADVEPKATHIPVVANRRDSPPNCTYSLNYGFCYGISLVVGISRLLSISFKFSD